MTKRFGLILISALAIAWVASFASAASQTSTWISTDASGMQNWALSTNGRMWDQSAPTTNDPWNVNPLWNGTDNLVFNNGADVFMQHAETVQNMTCNGNTYFNDYYGESGANGAGLDTNGKPTNYSPSGLYGLTIANSLTVNGGQLRIGENSYWDGIAPQLSFEAGSNVTINLLCGFDGNYYDQTASIRCATGFYAGAGATINLVGDTNIVGWASNNNLWINSSTGANFSLTNNVGLTLGCGITASGTLTVNASPGCAYGTTLQLGHYWSPNAGPTTYAGNIVLNSGAVLSTYDDATGGDNYTGIITGQITGDATTSFNVTRGQNGVLSMTYVFAPATGTNSGFHGTFNVNAATDVFHGTWSNLGNVNIGASDWTDHAIFTGDATMGMAAGMKVTVAGGGNMPTTAILAPTGGKLTFGTQGNGNTVSFQNLSQLTLNLNDVKADGITPVADSLVIQGNLDLGAAGTTNALAINFTSISKTTAYTLATFNSISSAQTEFGSVIVNGVTLAGDGTALSSIDQGTKLSNGSYYGGHHLVYTPGTGAAGSGKLVLATELIPGDINADGLVDVADYDIWAANVGATGATWAQGDLNGDGLVDVADYDIWAANVGATAATPEPVSMIILAIGGGLVALKRRNG